MHKYYVRDNSCVVATCFKLIEWYKKLITHRHKLKANQDSNHLFPNSPYCNYRIITPKKKKKRTNCKPESTHE